MARREYSTAWRPFADSEEEVEIQWYRAAEGAPNLGRSCATMSIDWLALGYDRREVQVTPGEVFNVPRPYSRFTPPLFLDYLHVCGTDEEFADGAQFDPDRDVKYDEQSLPLCCNGPRVMRFPLVIGFNAIISSIAEFSLQEFCHSTGEAGSYEVLLHTPFPLFFPSFYRWFGWGPTVAFPPYPAKIKFVWSNYPEVVLIVRRSCGDFPQATLNVGDEYTIPEPSIGDGIHTQFATDDETHGDFQVILQVIR